MNYKILIIKFSLFLENFLSDRFRNNNNNNNNAGDLQKRRSLKRSFTERENNGNELSTMMMLDADDVDEIDEDEDKEDGGNDENDSASPRSCSSPNGSLNGSLLSMATASGNGHHGMMHSSGKKARKARTIFTDKQLHELESMFDKHKYLSVQDRMDLAQRMGLSDTQVKTWYQNRR